MSENKAPETLGTCHLNPKPHEPCKHADPLRPLSPAPEPHCAKPPAVCEPFVGAGPCNYCAEGKPYGIKPDFAPAPASPSEETGTAPGGDLEARFAVRKKAAEGCGLCGGKAMIQVVGADGRRRSWECDECRPAPASAESATGPREALATLMALIDTFHPPLAEMYPGLRATLAHCRSLLSAPSSGPAPRDERLTVIARPDLEKCQHGLRRSDCEWCVFSGTVPPPQSPEAPPAAPSPAPSGPGLTEERLDELERLAREATPGPWHTEGRRDGWGNHIAIVPDGKGGEDAVAHAWSNKEWRRDARFIAAANPETVLALLAEVRSGRSGRGGGR